MLNHYCSFTSVAFAHTASPDKEALVQTWPGGSTGGLTADQVPTVVFYTNPSTRECLWGNNISGAQSKKGKLKWFKLLLQHNPATVGTHYAAPKAFARASGRTPPSTGLPPGRCTVTAETPAFEALDLLLKMNLQPVDVVQDFLQKIKTVILDSIGGKYDREFALNSKVEYILTIPAIWEDPSKALMIRAAEAAGYGRHRTEFHLVTEPEAAAAYTLKVIRPHDFKRDDVFVICDAGGGTVDLIAYKVKSLEPLRVDEVVSGTGDLCGSVYLDQRFKEYMKQLLGKDTYDSMSQRSKFAMNNYWEEQVKFKFGTSEEEAPTYEVWVPNIPDNQALGIEESFHTMSR
jgi:hypothetical protein